MFQPSDNELDQLPYDGDVYLFNRTAICPRLNHTETPQGNLEMALGQQEW